MSTDDAEKSVHVTGLPANATEEQVRTIFAAYGTVASLKVLPQKEDKPDAAAIITMENADQAKWLVENLNDKVPAGLSTPLIVKKKITNTWGKGYGKGMPAWAYQQMMQYYGGGKGKGKGWGSGLSSFPAEKKVWIGGLPEENPPTFQELQAHFPGCKFATVMKGKGAGTGGVAFATEEEATAAIATLNGSVLAGATLEVDVWTKKEKEEGEQGVCFDFQKGACTRGDGCRFKHELKADAA